MSKPKTTAPIADRYLLLASRFTGITNYRRVMPAAALAADPVALSEYQALVGIAKAMRAAVAAQPPVAAWTAWEREDDPIPTPAGIESSHIARHLMPVVTGSAAAKGYHVELMTRYLADTHAVLIRTDDNGLGCIFPESDGKRITGPAILDPQGQVAGNRPDLRRGPEPRPVYRPLPGPRPDLRGKPRLNH